MAALVGIATDLRAILAAHAALQLMDRRRLRSSHDVQGDGLMRVAAEAFHFEIAKPGVDRVAQHRRWLRRTLKAEHALVPRLDGEPIGFLARLQWPAPPLRGRRLRRSSPVTWYPSGENAPGRPGSASRYGLRWTNGGRR
jgi:hypothetical protein